MYLERFSNNQKTRLAKVLKLLETEHKIVLDFNDLAQINTAKEIAQSNVDIIKNASVSVFEETNKHLAPSYLVLEAVKLNNEINMKRINEEHEIHKAEYLLASKNIVDDLQKMLEKLSDIQAQQLPAIVDKMKLDAGVAAAENYKTTAATLLAGVIDSINSTKEGMDNLTLGLSGDVDMSGAGADMATQEPAMDDVDLGTEEPEVPAEEPKKLVNPLGRERKEESKKKSGKTLNEAIRGLKEPGKYLVNRAENFVVSGPWKRASEAFAEREDYEDKDQLIVVMNDGKRVFQVNRNGEAIGNDLNESKVTENKKWRVTVEEPALPHEKNLPVIAKLTIEAETFKEAVSKAKESVMKSHKMKTWDKSLELLVKPLKEAKEEITSSGLKVWHVQAKAPETDKLFGNYKAYAPSKGLAIAKAKKAVEKKHGTVEVVFTIKEMNKDAITESTFRPLVYWHDGKDERDGIEYKGGPGYYVAHSEEDPHPKGPFKTKEAAKKSIGVKEAWENKMHTNPKDKGKWEGWTKEELKHKLSSLQKKKEHSNEETKTIKQLEFALRAKGKGKKHTSRWGKVKESHLQDGEYKQLAQTINAIPSHREYAHVMQILGFFVDGEQRMDDETVVDALKAAPDHTVSNIESMYGYADIGQQESVDYPNTFADDACDKCACNPCECVMEAMDEDDVEVLRSAIMDVNSDSDLQMIFKQIGLDPDAIYDFSEYELVKALKKLDPKDVQDLKDWFGIEESIKEDNVDDAIARVQRPVEKHDTMPFELARAVKDLAVDMARTRGIGAEEALNKSFENALPTIKSKGVNPEDVKRFLKIGQFTESKKKVTEAFKVGDKVYVKASKDLYHGQIGTISSIDNEENDRPYYDVKFDSGNQSFNSSQIQNITEAPNSAQTITAQQKPMPSMYKPSAANLPATKPAATPAANSTTPTQKPATATFSAGDQVTHNGQKTTVASDNGDMVGVQDSPNSIVRMVPKSEVQKNVTESKKHHDEEKEKFAKNFFANFNDKNGKLNAYECMEDAWEKYIGTNNVKENVKNARKIQMTVETMKGRKGCKTFESEADAKAWMHKHGHNLKSVKLDESSEQEDDLTDVDFSKPIPVPPGYYIEQVAPKMIEIAKKKNHNVTYRFGDLNIEVAPTDKVEDVWGKFYKPKENTKVKEDVVDFPGSTKMRNPNLEKFLQTKNPDGSPKKKKPSVVLDLKKKHDGFGLSKAQQEKLLNKDIKKTNEGWIKTHPSSQERSREDNIGVQVKTPAGMGKIVGEFKRPTFSAMVPFVHVVDVELESGKKETFRANLVKKVKTKLVKESETKKRWIVNVSYKINGKEEKRSPEVFAKDKHAAWEKILTNLDKNPKCSEINMINIKEKTNENATAGATSAGGIASIPKSFGTVQRRKPVDEDFHDDQVSKIYKLKTTNPTAWEAKCKELGIPTKAGKNEIAVALVKKK